MSDAWISKFKEVKQATRLLRSKTQQDLKNSVLLKLAAQLRLQQVQLLEKNVQDLKHPDLAKRDLAFKDRLKLNPERIEAMAKGLEFVAGLEDPVGQIAEEFVLPNGLEVKKVRSPLGVLLMIFESRPNVVTDAFALAFKSSNGLILRGGKESAHSCAFLYKLINEAIESVEPQLKSVFLGVVDQPRDWIKMALSQKEWIDVVVPRGGDSLIQFVVQNSQIPIIKNDRGMCHIYVHEDADLAMAQSIVINAKVQRPGVCNALETLIVHKNIATDLTLQLLSAQECKNLKFRIDPVLYSQIERLSPTLSRVEKLKGNDDPAWDTEYLDLVLNIKQVENLSEALKHIEIHGSKHSEAIITQSEPLARQFMEQVDAAAVYWNASTRFTDGFELGLGGELGISTQKLHVRGPVGLKELTSLRWVIQGKGQVRV